VSKAEAAALAKPSEPVGKKKIAVPPMPAKPDYARPATTATAAADAATRRSFMAVAAGALFGSSMAIGFSSLAATHLMWLLGLARFMFPNILTEPPTRFKVGFPDELSPGQGEIIRESQIWKSIFRHPMPVDRRNRIVVMLTNFFLHLHPVSIKKQGIALSYTWCMGGVTFFLFLVETSPACC
jgi:hypothetical protein